MRVSNLSVRAFFGDLLSKKKMMIASACPAGVLDVGNPRMQFQEEVK
jgi:hypothetical protein